MLGLRSRNSLTVVVVLMGLCLLFGNTAASALDEPVLIGGPQDQAVAVYPGESGSLLLVGALSEGAVLQGTWVASLDQNLNQRWRRDHFIDGTLGIGASVQRVSGGVVVAIPRVRSITGDVAHGPAEDQRLETVLIAVDDSGNLVWDTILHVGGGVQITAMQQDGYDGYVVGGLIYNSANEQGAWVAKLDGSGAIVWHRDIPGGAQVHAVARQADGLIVAVGSAVVSDDPFAIIYEAPWMSVLDPLGDVSWSRTVGDGRLGVLKGLHLVEDAYVATGYLYDPQVEAALLDDDDAAGWIVQLDRNGVSMHERNIDALDTARGSTILNDGRYVVYGAKNGRAAAAVASLAQSQEVLDLIPDMAVPGAANSALASESDIFVVGQSDMPIGRHGAWIFRAKGLSARP